jgi:hypothetical protein
MAKVSDLLPEQGARPWLPASNVTAVMTLNQYDIPLSGLVEQNGATYLYVCLLGELEELNIWAYAPLGDPEGHRLVTLRDDELAAAIDEALANRMLIVALADDHELAAWLRIDSGVEGPLALAKRFVGQLGRRLARTQENVRELGESRELASA